MSPIAIILPLLAAVPLAQEAPTESAESGPRTFVTHHTGTFHGTELAYTATVEEVILETAEGEPEASIFTIAYVREGTNDASQRPVTFLWNGGPGSSSVWLHMGVFGPKRVDVPSDARDDGGPPYGLVDNPGCMLDVTDIVFIDPVGTGFSRPLGEAEGKDFYGVHEDARSVARVLRQWISEHGRWNSPKFIGGESYGTTRSAAVIRELEGGFDDVAINGIILISAILDFTIDGPTPGNELPYLTHLPTQAATAHYHGKAGQGVPIEAFVQEAREFALGPLAQALLQGNDLLPDVRARIRSELARFTGLSEDYIERSDLRIRSDRFQKELLRDRGLTIERLDARYTGEDLDDAGEYPDVDPSFYGIDGAYTSALNAYLRGPLGVEIDRDYTILGGVGRWDWESGARGRSFYFNVAPYIGTAMRQNSGLQVFVAAGYYDFATPFFGAEYSLNRAGVVSERLHFAYYEAGHMMYVHHPSLAKLMADVRTFLVEALR